MKKVKIRRLNKSQRIIFIVFISLLSLTLVVSFGKYIYNSILDIYFTTKNFYFESTKLKQNGATYALDYWNGVDPYQIVIDLSTEKNNALKTQSDVTYRVTYNCSSEITCQTTKTSGTIYAASNQDSFIFTIDPRGHEFDDGDSVSATIQAQSQAPYQKTLSATFTLVVGRYGLSHAVEDQEGDVYLTLKVTNTLETYQVIEAFDNYSVGDSIPTATYNNLSNSNKEKCTSAIINVSFDPEVIYIDNNNTTYLNSYNRQTQTINHYQYVNAFTFNMDATSSSIVRFYKKNPNLNYSQNYHNILQVSYSY